jgi:aspartyl/glutamyl-tRNA(Asn/Gln) amidotransferase C subunit
MLFTEEELDNLSKLARIDITMEEKPKMLTDMQAILSYISEINEVSGDILREGESLCNVVREDVITHVTGSNTAAILANAPKVKNGYVEVEQVLK